MKWPPPPPWRGTARELRPLDVWAVLPVLLLLGVHTAGYATPVVDCHGTEQCLEALRTHLQAMHAVDAGLHARAASSSAMSLPHHLLQMHTEIDRFMALADRMGAIVDFLTHEVPHVPLPTPDFLIDEIFPSSSRS